MQCCWLTKIGVHPHPQSTWIDSYSCISSGDGHIQENERDILDKPRGAVILEIFAKSSISYWKDINKPIPWLKIWFGYWSGSGVVFWVISNRKCVWHRSQTKCCWPAVGGWSFPLHPCLMQFRRWRLSFVNSAAISFTSLLILLWAGWINRKTSLTVHPISLATSDEELYFWNSAQALSCSFSSSILRSLQRMLIPHNNPL